MNPLDDNEAFWRSSDCHIAVNPHRVGDADGLAGFADSNTATCGLIFFQTSGSEGIPKWCGLSRAAMLASARAVNAHLKVSSEDHWLIALPLHHVGGFSILARCFAIGSSFAIMNEKWNAADFANLCAEKKITLTSLVPTQIFDLVQAKIHAPPSLRAVLVGGAGLNREIGNEARRLGWPVIQSYGMTETSSQIATGSLDGLREEFDPDKMEVLTIWELSSDDDLRLTVRGAALATGYAVMTSDGWKWEEISPSLGMCTRDRVEIRYLCGVRYLKFLGRETAFVKVLGEMVNLETLQARLEALADLSQRVVICALPDDRKGNKLGLAGDMPLAKLEELRAIFNVEVAGIQRIEECVTLPVVPRTALGKLDRPALAEMLARL